MNLLDFACTCFMFFTALKDQVCIPSESSSNFHPSRWWSLYPQWQHRQPRKAAFFLWYTEFISIYIRNITDYRFDSDLICVEFVFISRFTIIYIQLQRKHCTRMYLAWRLHVLIQRVLFPSLVNRRWWAEARALLPQQGPASDFRKREELAGARNWVGPNHFW